jgi:nitrite reductase (NADH) small subunit
VFDLSTGACRSGQDDVASYAVRVEEGRVVIVLPGPSGSADRTG